MPRIMSPNGRRGGVLAGIMLMTLIVGLAGLAALVCTGLYVADHVRMTRYAGGEGHGEVSIETPVGSIRVHDRADGARFDPKLMGVPIYPGAVREHDARKLASFHLDFGDMHKDFAVSAAAYRTSDSIERVTDFYRGELPHWLISQEEHGCMHLSFTKHGYKRVVAIYEQNGETRIALASMGEPASN
jgi:hypothetical protein